MKILKKIGLFIGACYLMTACSPKENRTSLGIPIAKSELKFAVTQQAGHDNVIMVKNNTPGIIPFWDFGNGVSNKQQDTTILPFAGEFFIRFTAYSKGGPVSDSVKVKISNNDANYFKSPMWNLLTNGIAGKTWVWAADNPTGWVHGNGPQDAVVPQWWQVPASGLGADLNDEMSFNINGNANYLKITGKGQTKGIFTLDTLNKTLKITGADISEGSGNSTLYNIAKLTENELTIVQIGNGFSNQWLFKRKGYKY
ncbi:hypothetical protein [Mucilaginibacter lappiensis]|uniref:PKD domain-containing protein n=1 Tax=Mucilaginibacter lappiensis TaxID=354630 RepID=A0A841JPI3_9SPHI|nr:hypothetical protein [Mucilaginibacter lappiensis]MBB6130668.1 hypothetical protein [Mucilaginibacter lappiensis]